MHNNITSLLCMFGEFYLINPIDELYKGLLYKCVSLYDLYI